MTAPMDTTNANASAEFKMMFEKWELEREKRIKLEQELEKLKLNEVIETPNEIHKENNVSKEFNINDLNIKALNYAAKSNNFNMIKNIVNKVYYSNDTALFLACYIGDLTITQYLVEKCNVPINKMFENSYAINEAVFEGHLNIVEYLVSKGADIFNNDLLEPAAYKGHFDIVKYVLKYFDPKCGNFRINKAINACCRGHQVEIAKYLIENYNADLNNALLSASANGNYSIIKYTLEDYKRKADINTKSADGKTAMFYVCEGGYLEIVRYLFTRGARFEESIMPIIVVKGYVNILHYLYEKKIINDNFKTYVELAAEHGQLEIIKYFIKYTHINYKNDINSQKQVLIKACKKENNLEVVKYLINEVGFQI